MKHKVLITTTVYGPVPASVVIVDFDTEITARAALRIINTNTPSPATYRQTALYLGGEE